jgi:p-hydroxybenzoate 3-monooxygenase
MNMALFDAEMLAKGLRAQLRDADGSGLAAYSATCLNRVWRYQDYTRWLIELTHEAGDEATAGPFRKRSGRARLDVLFSSPGARRLFAEYQNGIV